MAAIEDIKRIAEVEFSDIVKKHESSRLQIKDCSPE